MIAELCLDNYLTLQEKGRIGIMPSLLFSPVCYFILTYLAFIKNLSIRSVYKISRMFNDYAHKQPLRSEFLSCSAIKTCLSVEEMSGVAGVDSSVDMREEGTLLGRGEVDCDAVGKSLEEVHVQVEDSHLKGFEFEVEE